MTDLEPTVRQWRRNLVESIKGHPCEGDQECKNTSSAVFIKNGSLTFLCEEHQNHA